MKIEPNWMGRIIHYWRQEVEGGLMILTTKYVRSSMLVSDTGMIRTIELQGRQKTYLARLTS